MYNVREFRGNLSRCLDEVEGGKVVDVVRGRVRFKLILAEDGDSITKEDVSLIVNEAIEKARGY